LKTSDSWASETSSIIGPFREFKNPLFGTRPSTIYFNDRGIFCAGPSALIHSLPPLTSVAKISQSDFDAQADFVQNSVVKASPS